jgi:hypothetical protein
MQNDQENPIRPQSDEAAAQQPPQQVVVSAEQLDLWDRLLKAMSTTVRNLRSQVVAHEERITSLEDMLLQLTSPPRDRGTMN